MTIQETQQLAERLASRIEHYRVFALVGELGSGKTTFTQFFLRALGVHGPITSPTFVIIKSYKLQAIYYKIAYHIDCYRVRDPHELIALGFQDICANPKALVIIEWADRVRDLLPPDVVWIYFVHGAQERERAISIVVG